MTGSVSKRAINLGSPIKLASFEEPLVVKEPTLEGVIRISNELLLVLNAFTSIPKEDQQDGMRIMAKLVSSPATLQAVKAVFSEVTGLPVAEFQDLPVSDVLKLVEKIKEVLDWDALKDLFMRILPSPIVDRFSNSVKVK